MKRVITIAFLFFSLGIFAQNNEQLFNDANTLYNNGSYLEAIKKYEDILETGVHSAELYFNLGNANYKLNKIAPSIYYYEKALMLDPNDSEIKNNLAFAQNMTIDAIETVPEMGISKFVDQVINIFGFNGWAWISVGFMLLFVTLFISYYFIKTTHSKRLTFIISSASIFLMLISLAFAFKKYDMVQNDKQAIVFSQEAEIRSEPNLRSVEAFKLHEGTKVQVLESVNNWKKIRIADGKTGWVTNDDIKVLNKF